MTPAPHIPPTTGVLDKLQRRTLMKVLEQIPDRLEDLDVTITRTDSMKPMNLGITNGSEERSVPFNQAASDARVELVKQLRVYALRVKLIALAPVREGDPHAYADYLVQHLPGIPDNHPAITGIYTAIVGAADKARRAMDRPIDRKYVGLCDCGTSLYAADQAAFVKCRTCKLLWSASERREWLLDEARDRVGSPEALEKILPWFDERPIKANTIRQWARRGKLQADANGLYRIGDVIALHRASSPAAA